MRQSSFQNLVPFYQYHKNEIKLNFVHHIQSTLAEMRTIQGVLLVAFINQACGLVKHNCTLSFIILFNIRFRHQSLNPEQEKLIVHFL